MRYLNSCWEHNLFPGLCEFGGGFSRHFSPVVLSLDSSVFFLYIYPYHSARDLMELLWRSSGFSSCEDHFPCSATQIPVTWASLNSQLCVFNSTLLSSVWAHSSCTVAWPLSPSWYRELPLFVTLLSGITDLCYLLSSACKTIVSETPSYFLAF